MAKNDKIISEKEAIKRIVLVNDAKDEEEDYINRLITDVADDASEMENLYEKYRKKDKELADWFWKAREKILDSRDLLVLIKKRLFDGVEEDEPKKDDKASI